MNWEIIGATGEWAGALIVVATLFYLSRQIKESNDRGRAEAIRGWFSDWHTIVRSWAEDEETAELFQRALNQYETLSRSERLRFHSRFCQIPDHIDSGHRMYLEGQLPEQMHDSIINNLLAFINTPGGTLYWNEVGHQFGIYPYLETIKDRDVPAITETVDFFRMDSEDIHNASQ